jgi:hypothetical protein
MPPAGAQPAGMDPRSASGEIVVGPARARIKQSPAAEVRLAHLREESARALVRPSQSVTPAGSARALDEPPPLLEGPLPEPPVRKPEALAVRRPTTDEFTVADEAAELGFGSRRRGRLLIGTVALAVIAGGLFLMERRRSESSSDLVAEPSGSAGSGPPPVAPTILPLPSPPSAGAGTANDPSAAATAHGLDAGAPGGDAVERDADPKMARARAGDAAVYLNACHLAFQEQRMKDAEAACTAARDANPDSAEAQGWLAHALFNRNRRREALIAAERAVRLNPKWADAYVIIGGVHQDVGEVDDAKRAYQRYLELDPHGQYSGDLRAIVDRLGKL